MFTLASQKPKKPTKMPLNPKSLSKWFIIFLLSGLVIIGGYNFWRSFGPRSMVAPYTPFGLPAHTKINVGQSIPPKPDIHSLSPQAKVEWENALSLFKQQSWQKAAERFDLLSSQYPQFKVALYYSAYCRLQLEPTTFTIGAVRNTIALFQKMSGTQAGAAYLSGLAAQIFDQDTIAALGYFKTVTQKAPQYGPAHYKLANLYLHNKQAALAIDHYRAAISLQAEVMPLLLGQLAQGYMFLGHADSVQAILEYSQKQWPDHPALLLAQGYLHEVQNEFAAAESKYRQILQRQPQNALAREALRTLGEKPDIVNNAKPAGPRMYMKHSLDIIEPLLEQFPENLALHFAKGQALYQGRDYVQAQKTFEYIASIDSGFPNIQRQIQNCKEAANFATLPVDNRFALLDSVNKMAPRKTERSSFEKLGHYLVRWGAPPKEFFKRYAANRFVKLRDNAYRESFYEESFLHEYTIVFDSTGLYGVHVQVTDTAFHEKEDLIFDLYGKFIKTNSRITGIGSSTGESQCGGAAPFQAVIWEKQDNFELLAQFSNARNKIQMIRLAKHRVPKPFKLCYFLPYLKQP
jgi:tetratricopeptide (TPR) repeat protein